VSLTPHFVRIKTVGDFDIAPDDRDVYGPDGWRGRDLCSEPERYLPWLLAVLRHLAGLRVRLQRGAWARARLRRQ
jgi:hypothetical protein